MALRARSRKARGTENAPGPGPGAGGGGGGRIGYGCEQVDGFVADLPDDVVGGDVLGDQASGGVSPAVEIVGFG